jgi:hypothetical protein
MITLELGERLRVRIEVVEGEPSSLLGRQAAFFPASRQGDEVAGGGEFDVDLQFVLEAGDGAEHGVLLWDELQVDVDRRPPPAEEHGGGAAGQVAAPRLLGGLVERGQQALDPLGVG